MSGRSFISPEKALWWPLFWFWKDSSMELSHSRQAWPQKSKTEEQATEASCPRPGKWPALVHPTHWVPRARGRGLLCPDWANRGRQWLLCHHWPRGLGHCLVHQRSAHPWDQCGQGEDLHLCGGGRWWQAVCCGLPSLLHHWWPRGRLWAQVRGGEAAAPGVCWGQEHQVWRPSANSHRQTLRMERGCPESGKSVHILWSLSKISKSLLSRRSARDLAMDPRLPHSGHSLLPVLHSQIPWMEN